MGFARARRWRRWRRRRTSIARVAMRMRKVMWMRRNKRTGAAPSPKG
jgi:hypothetical protein